LTTSQPSFQHVIYGSRHKTKSLQTRPFGFRLLSLLLRLSMTQGLAVACEIGHTEWHEST
jgi:hypothetical protein